MRILVVNCGSSSLKYTLFVDEREAAGGLVEKIGETESAFTRAVDGKRRDRLTVPVPDHARAIALMREWLLRDGIIRDVREIDAVGHRVVHGGPAYRDAALVDDAVRGNRIARELAPLHQVNYDGIEATLAMLPDTPQVAVFDTAFHQTMPAQAYLYALPYEYIERYSLRRYGFHGTSHKYLALRTSQLLKRRNLRVITLHLGNGSSIAAVRNGRCQDTSMGLTPLAGVVMGSRCGDIDPAIVPYLMEREGLSPQAMDALMNKRSGVLGLSGVSNDLREVLARARQGDHRSRLALDVLVYSIQKYIGAYWAVLGGVDALVFSAGIGEKSPVIRERICRGLSGLGLRLDLDRNRRTVGCEGAIHHPRSKVKVWVVPTREEYMIAQETRRILARRRVRRGRSEKNVDNR